jgi:hypothetical protein
MARRKKSLQDPPEMEVDEVSVPAEEPEKQVEQLPLKVKMAKDMKEHSKFSKFKKGKQ